MSYLLLFHCYIGCMKAPQCYVYKYIACLIFSDVMLPVSQNSQFSPSCFSALALYPVYPTKTSHATFSGLTSALLKNQLRDVTVCRLVDSYRRFEALCFLNVVNPQSIRYNISEDVSDSTSDDDIYCLNCMYG